MADISYLASTISARNQMEFQREMSNTAHQREVEDLKKAGLNPILSAHTQGASTPTGASGDYGDMAGVFDALTKSLDTNAKAVSKAMGVASKALNKKDSDSVTGYKPIDTSLEQLKKRYPMLGLVIGAGQYALENGKVGANVPISGSSAKARERYLATHVSSNNGPAHVRDSNTNSDSRYRFTSLPGYNSAKKFLKNITEYNRSLVRMPGK